MKGLLVFAAFVGCCVARPDIGLKLRQQGLQVPSTNYGYPAGRYLPPSDIGNSGSHQQHYYQNHQGPSQGSFGTGSHHTQSGGESSFHAIHSGSNFENSGSSFDSSSHHASQGSTLVNKHIYFFDAPEDIPAPQIRINQQQVENKKNYKIIFIKAPSYQAPQIQIPTVQPQNAEKTLIYVLVKKPEDVQDIEIPSIAPTKPSKPEVFFIKYKTQKEAQEKIQHIQNGGSGDGIVSTDLGSDASFVNSIHDEKSGGNIITGPGHVSETRFEHISASGHDSTGGDHGYEYSTPGSTGGHVHPPSALYA